MQVVDLATIANVATALTLIAGVGFGLVEAHRSRRLRQERAAFAAVQAILTPEWMKSMVVVHSIPDGSSASAIEADPRVLDAAHAGGIILEGLGYSVYARIISLQVVADIREALSYSSAHSPLLKSPACSCVSITLPVSS